MITMTICVKAEILHVSGEFVLIRAINGDKIWLDKSWIVSPTVIPVAAGQASAVTYVSGDPSEQ